MINYVSRYDGMGTLLLLSLTSPHQVYASVYEEKNQEKDHFLLITHPFLLVSSLESSAIGVLVISGRLHLPSDRKVYLASVS